MTYGEYLGARHELIVLGMNQSDHNFKRFYEKLFVNMEIAFENETEDRWDWYIDNIIDFERLNPIKKIYRLIKVSRTVKKLNKKELRECVKK